MFSIFNKLYIIAHNILLYFLFSQDENLDEEKILNKIESVQQSKKEFLISDGATELDFFHVHYPKGAVEPKGNTYTWIRKTSRKQKEPSFKRYSSFTHST
jgi:hypothetical protein